MQENLFCNIMTKSNIKSNIFRIRNLCHESGLCLKYFYKSVEIVVLVLLLLFIRYWLFLGSPKQFSSAQTTSNPIVSYILNKMFAFAVSRSRSQTFSSQKSVLKKSKGFKRQFCYHTIESLSC